MSWKCFLVERRMGAPRPGSDGAVVTPAEFFRYGEKIEWADLPVGAMWFDGPLLFVRLPAYIDWCIDRPGTGGSKWTRSGEPPDVNVIPSINYVGIYHGWVRNGWVTDDCEGRKFDDAGRALT